MDENDPVGEFEDWEKQDQPSHDEERRALYAKNVEEQRKLREEAQKDA